MLRIKNKTYQPIPLSLRSLDQRAIETLILPARGEILLEEELSTEFIDNLAKSGRISIVKS